MAPPRQKDLPPKASDIFVNRDEPLTLFKAAAAAIPREGTILRVFYGVGGQGKTALCRQLFRLTDKAKDPAYGFLRRAYIDLRDRPSNDPDLLLMRIRNSFARAGVALPALDLALAIAWEASRGDQPFPKLTNAWLTNTQDAIGEFGGHAVQTVRELIEETAEDIPGLGVLLGLVGHWMAHKTKRSYLERTRESLKALYYNDGKLKNYYEISALLPWMLAQDLNHFIRENPEARLLLLIDGYEQIFEEGMIGTRWRDNTLDSHLRTLITESDGLLAVIFSRERLPWEEDPDWRGSLEDNQHLLDGLTEPDAEAWLKAVPIHDQEVRHKIIESARDKSSNPATIVPSRLAVIIDHWCSLAAENAVIIPDLYDPLAFDRWLDENYKRIHHDGPTDSEEPVTTESVPALPEPEPGLSFQLRRDGKLEFAPTGQASAEDRIEIHAFVNELSQTIDDLIAALKGSNAHASIANLARRYQEVLLADPLLIDQLYSSGVRLENTYVSLQRDIDDDDYPDMGFAASEALGSFLKLHRTIITSTARGNQLLGRVRAYGHSNLAEAEIRTVSQILAGAIDRAKDMATEEVRTSMVAINSQIGEGPHPDLSTEIARTTNRNFLNVAAMFAVAGVGGSAIFSSALSASIPGAMLTEVTTIAIDQCWTFFTANLSLLREFAAVSGPEMSWITALLDWIERKLR